MFAADALDLLPQRRSRITRRLVQRQGPLHHRGPVRELAPLYRTVGIVPIRRPAIDLQRRDVALLPAVFAIAGRLRYRRLLFGVARGDTQRPPGRHQQAHQRMFDRHRPLQFGAAGDLAAEDGIVAVHAERVLDDVADADILQQHAGGHAAVVDQVIQFGLALQDMDARSGQFRNHRAVAQHVDRMQRQRLVRGIEVDADVGDLLHTAAIQRLAGGVKIRHLAARVDPGLHVAQQIGHTAARGQRCGRRRMKRRHRLHPRGRRAGFIGGRPRPSARAKEQQAQHHNHHCTHKRYPLRN